MQEFKVGDRVEVVDAGSGYSSYISWAIEYGLKNFKQNQMIINAPSRLGEVVAIGPHGCSARQYLATVCAGVRIEGQDYIIDTQGLKLLPSTPEPIEYFMVYDKKTRPCGVVCVLNEDGMKHVGISWCNLKEDVFCRSEGENRAHERVTMARDHEMTAYFKDGSPMMIFDWDGGEL